MFINELAFSQFVVLKMPLILRLNIHNKSMSNLSVEAQAIAGQLDKIVSESHQWHATLYSHMINSQ